MIVYLSVITNNRYGYYIIIPCYFLYLVRSVIISCPIKQKQKTTELVVNAINTTSDFIDLSLFMLSFDNNMNYDANCSLCFCFMYNRLTINYGYMDSIIPAIMIIYLYSRSSFIRVTMTPILIYHTNTIG